MSIDVRPSTKCSLEAERVAFPEEVHSRVIFGHRLGLLFFVGRLWSLNGSDRLADSGERHEVVGRDGRPVLPRLEHMATAVEGSRHIGGGLTHTVQVCFEPRLQLRHGVEAVRDLEALNLAHHFGHASVFVKVDDRDGLVATNCR